MLIRCTAPIRICDLGGWTDTWFAGHGQVLNFAVFPFVEVTVQVRPRQAAGEAFLIHTENYGETFALDGEGLAKKTFTKHPLIEAACRSFAVPEDQTLDISLFSEAPAGASTGTSAAVSVALIGALDLLGGKKLTSYEIARRSHHLETEVLGLQAGIQDQLSSAYGGIQYIQMDRYPQASVSPVFLPDETLWELESRLLLVYLGQPHSSSEVHREVIARLEESPHFREHLNPLRECARQGKEALLANDLIQFGQIMNENTEAQRSMHPQLIGQRAQMVIDLAKSLGVQGYKVNGAGGEGGSVTLLLPPGLEKKRQWIKAIEEAHPEFTCIPTNLAPHGLRRWKV